jgi:hypothetical protein
MGYYNSECELDNYKLQDDYGNTISNISNINNQNKVNNIKAVKEDDSLDKTVIPGDLFKSLYLSPYIVFRTSDKQLTKETFRSDILYKNNEYESGGYLFFQYKDVFNNLNNLTNLLSSDKIITHFCYATILDESHVYINNVNDNSFIANMITLEAPIHVSTLDFWTDKVRVINLCKHDPRLVIYNKIVKEEFIEKLIKSNYVILKHIDKTYINIIVWINLIFDKPSVVKEVPDDMITQSMWDIAVDLDVSLIIDCKFKTKEMILKACLKDGLVTQYLTKDEITLEVAKLSIEQNDYSLQYCKHIVDYDTCLRAVTRTGFILEHVPEELVTQEMCTLAVTKCPGAIKFVSERFYTERLGILSVESFTYNIQHIKNITPKLATYVFKKCHMSLSFMNKKEKTVSNILESVMYQTTSFIKLDRINDKLDADMYSLMLFLNPNIDNFIYHDVATIIENNDIVKSLRENIKEVTKKEWKMFDFNKDYMGNIRNREENIRNREDNFKLDYETHDDSFNEYDIRSKRSRSMLNNNYTSSSRLNNNSRLSSSINKTTQVRQSYYDENELYRSNNDYSEQGDDYNNFNKNIDTHIKDNWEEYLDNDQENIKNIKDNQNNWLFENDPFWKENNNKFSDKDNVVNINNINKNSYIKDERYSMYDNM